MSVEFNIIEKNDIYYLFTSDTGVSVGRGTENKVVKHRGVRRNTNSAAYHNCDFKFVPVLIASAKGAFDPYLRMLVFRIVVTRVEIVSKLPCPWTLGLDMA